MWGCFQLDPNKKRKQRNPHLFSEHVSIIHDQSKHYMQWEWHRHLRSDGEDRFHTVCGHQIPQRPHGFSLSPKDFQVCRAICFVYQQCFAEQAKTCAAGSSMAEIGAEELIIASQKNSDSLLEAFAFDLELDLLSLEFQDLVL